MTEKVFEHLPSLSPLSFFAVESDLRQGEKKEISGLKRRHYHIPETTDYSGQENFASLYMGWSGTGITASIEVSLPLGKSHYPSLPRGDAVELFFDTRDLKSAGFATSFCHHFLFLPAPEGEISAVELTRFRTEDSHPHCSSEDLEIQVARESGSYTANIFIPAHCLHGYDPKEFRRLGFAYRIHRTKGLPQEFAPVSTHYPIEQQPSLWSTLHLVDKE